VTTREGSRRPVIAAGILIGTGMGGFVDGIVLHQLLQWHNMLSTVRPATDLVQMKYNMFWDGVFHALTWCATAGGIARLWMAGKRADVVWSTPAFVGAMLVGWGLFNFVEGLVDHHLLGLHHVRPGQHEQAWDLGFLASGVLLIGGGVAALRRRSPPPASSAVAP
jgi:uncharacterized membrane protein